MSKMCLISPHWQTRIKGVPPTRFPHSLSVVENKAFTEQNKVFSEELLKQLERQVKRNHNTEVRFYETLEKYNVDDIPIPKLLLSTLHIL
ncbi:hypothetical protein COOONC_21938 [Cooperia oncophora]